MHRSLAEKLLDSERPMRADLYILMDMAPFPYAIFILIGNL